MAKNRMIFEKGNFDFLVLVSVVILAAGLIVLTGMVRTPLRLNSEAKVCEPCSSSNKPYCSDNAVLKCQGGCLKTNLCNSWGCGTKTGGTVACCNPDNRHKCGSNVKSSSRCGKVGLSGAVDICYNPAASDGGGTCGSVFYCCAEGQVWTHADKKCCNPGNVYNAPSQWSNNDTYCGPRPTP